MTMRGALLACAGLTALGHSAAAAAQTAPSPTPLTSVDTEGDSNDIIVTASKRREKLQDVPSAITAITGDAIRSQGVNEFRDYATLVPGLAYRETGVSGQGTIVLRGLNSGTQQTTATAAYYLDEIQFTPSGFLSLGGVVTPNLDLADVERIEVLKGPQGTLYGANNLGGVVRVISPTPTFDRISGRGSVEGTFIDGGGSGGAARGSINIPVSSGIALRAAGYYRFSPGFVDNTGTGTRDVNTSEVYGGRIALRLKPFEDLTIDLVGLFQKTHNVGAGIQDNLPGTLTPRVRRYSYNSAFDATNDVEYRIGSGTVSYDAGPLTWITTVSYGDYRFNGFTEYTESYLPLLAASLPASAKIAGQFSPNTRKWTAESRFVSNRIGSFEFVAGGYYTSENSRYTLVINTYNGAPLAQIAGPLGIFYRTNTLDRYEELAGFANATVYVSHSLDFTGGIRVSSTKDRNAVGAPVNGLQAISFFAPRAEQDFQASDQPVTYLATLRWRPIREISTYARVATGYRPGGPQGNTNVPPGTPTVVGADRTINYEVGAKGTFANGAVSFEASAYRIDWSDIQLNTLAGGAVLTLNSGKARVEGVELSLAARPARGLSLTGNFGYTNARLTAIAAGSTAFLGAKVGDRLPITPKATAAAMVDYSLPLGKGIDGSVGLTGRYQSSAPSSFPGDPLNTNVTIPAYATLDLRAGLGFSRFKVFGRVTNLFDRYAITTLTTNRIIAGQNVPTIVTPIRPRTFTIGVSTEF